MNRRSFFGATAAAVVAGPSVAAEAVKALPARRGMDLATLGLSIDTAPLRAAATELAEISNIAGRIRPFDFASARSGNRYVYRTGYPAIDCLRSVSGVHRERMERRAAEASS